MRLIRLVGMTVAVCGLLVSTAGAQKNYSGTLSLGYVYLDEEGHQAVNQPTFNTYEGFALSLRNFRHHFADGSYLFGDLRNITLNNRRVYAGLMRPGQASVTLRHSQYRRIYSEDGGDFTRRSQISGTAWFQPDPSLRLFGGYGLTNKHGAFEELYELGTLPARGEVDYQHQNYHAGARLKHEQTTLEAEFRGTSFSDDLGNLDDRSSARFRVAAKAAVPQYRRLWLNAGFQHYEFRRDGADDTLSANTIWGGARLNLREGLSARYSFAWDRARRAGDLTSTDDIINSISAIKAWRGKGGVSAGYRLVMNDDAVHDVQSNGVYASGWVQASPRVNLRGDFGLTSRDDQDGTTVTGDEDLTRFRLSATYRRPEGRLRARFESRKREWDDIGSTADYTRIGADLRLQDARYAHLTASYYYMKGDYEDATHSFAFADHVITGQVESATYYGITTLVGGTYMKSQEDLDTERFSVSLGGRYGFGQRYTLEVIYTAHNFDDFLQADTAPLYTRYYTANIVEVNLHTELGK